jgi:hypothetical protein
MLGMLNRPDVEAAQRGLWRAGDELGYVSTNARNGTYGSYTSIDVERFRACTGIDGSGDQIGATLWPKIWPYIDANGQARFCDQPTAVSHPTPTAKTLPLKYGDYSKGVEACQRALWRALDGTAHARNGHYLDETADSVVRFRKQYVVNAGDDGNSIGGELWNVLTRWMDDYAVHLVHEWQPEQPPIDDAQTAAVETALGEVGYQEGAGNANKYGDWYGMPNSAWCAMFCCWCAEQNGSQTFERGSRYAYVPYLVEDAEVNRNGLRVVVPSSATRGDLVTFDWNDDGVADHVGFVVDGPGAGSSFHTVEGNTSAGSSGSQGNGDGVYQRTRYLADVCLFASFT